MREGVINYLASLGESGVRTSTCPKQYQTLREQNDCDRQQILNYNGSSLRLDADRASRRFVLHRHIIKLKKSACGRCSALRASERAMSTMARPMCIRAMRAIGYRVKAVSRAYTA